MAMKIELINTVYLFAAAQALLLILVILRKEQKATTEYWLLAVLVALIGTLLHYVVFLNGWLSPRSPLMDLGAVSWLTISPLLYFYSKSLGVKVFPWSWGYLLYFVFSLYLLIQLVLFSIGVRYGFFMLFSDMNTYTLSWILIYLLNSIVFSVASIRSLKRISIPRQRERVQWLVRYFDFFTLILSVLTVWLLYLMNARQFIQELEFVLLAFYAFFIFALVFKSLRYSNYFNDLSNQHYRNERRNRKDLQQVYEALEEQIKTEELFRDPGLNLSSLAQSVGVTENELSQVFSHHQTSFYKYVNGYRLQAFVEQFDEQELAKYTMTALAQRAGFSSRATFYKVFKLHYGVSPSAYLQQKAK